MSIVQNIEKEVLSLPRKELVTFRAWFEEFDAQEWDKQFKKDAISGKLDKLGKAAIRDFKKGKFQEL